MKDRKDQKHLINILKTTKDHHPNFVLFLGAGASSTSKVKLARDMIKEWRKVLYDSANTSEDYDTYLHRQAWHQKPEEYSVLFEALYDQPSQRREYIETCIRDAKPSWGYIYLVNLVRKNTFNTVFTTNFDDLLNEACYTFSNEVRPLVCAHDSSIRFVRVTSKRPKIIKIHGDFLFDNIKNTISELETLEQNTQEKFKQFASEFGFIFIGYAGNDRSVMDTLNNLLRFEDYFPHGVYWCVRRGSHLSEKVDLLQRHPKFHIVEIDGFDQFFATLNDALGHELQPEMSDPYTALVQRLNNMIDVFAFDKDDPANKILLRDIGNLGNHIQSVARFNNNDREFEVTIADSKVKLPIPYNLLARIKRDEGDFESAIAYGMKQFDIRQTPSSFADLFGLCIESGDSKHIDPMLEMLRGSPDSLLKDRAAVTFDFALSLIKKGMFDTAQAVLEIGRSYADRTGDLSYEMNFYTLNTLQILKHKGEPFSDDQRAQLEGIAANMDDELSRLGAFILLDNHAEAEKILKTLHKSTNIEFTLEWPILKWLVPHLKDSGLKKFFAKYQI